MSKQAKHTAGPWESRPTAGHDKHGQSAVYAETDSKDIAIVYDGDANASLIATAPELLEALETLAEYLEETHQDEIDNDHYDDGPDGCSYCEAIATAKELIRKANGQ